MKEIIKSDLIALKKSNRILKTMEISALLFFLCQFSLIAENVYPQQTELSLNLKNVTIKRGITEIEKASDYVFLITDEAQSELNKKTNLHADKESIYAVLEALLKDTQLGYTVVERQVSVYKSASPKAAVKSTKRVKEIKQQKKTITGKVTDQQGEVLIGANIVEKGTANGTITDVNGNFSLQVEDGAVLRVSYIGFLSQEINTAKRTSFTIVLKENLKGLDELIVVGYGTQKKVNLTGSVGSVTAKELAERPQPNVQNILQGKITGLQITTPTGQPGRDHGEILIRGKGSFGASSAPLILVDGLVGELNTLSPDDIESISVLKDAASASIYGARAANGVILVTTKKGRAGKPQISYSVNYGLQEATRLGDQVWDSATYMEMFNDMVDRMGGRTKYSQEMIDRYRDPNRDKDLYPNYNWMEETFKTGQILTHNLGMMGGNEKVTYNLSLGYLNQEGLLDHHTYDRYTGLINLEAQVHERIKTGVTSQFYYGKTHEPYYTNQSLTLMIASSRPMTKPYLPDGSGRYSYESFPESYGGEWQNRNPHWVMNETSRNIENWIANAQLYTSVDFIKKTDMALAWNTKGGFRFSSQFQNTHCPAYPQGYYYLKESDYLPGGRDEHILATDFFPEKGVSNYDQRVVYTLLSSLLNFNWNIRSEHAITALLGVQEEGQSLRSLSGMRFDYPSDSMTEIDGGSTVGQTLSGNISEYVLRSLFGRATYAYKGRYIAEANFRYDGTSRIHKDNRWGFFPSVSGAWRISEEPFIKDRISWMDNLKLRVTWGKLGNSEIGNYPYQDVYSTAAYIFNESAEQGVVLNALKDKTLQWETTTVKDIGLDINLGDGLFSLVFDWYDKVTDGILSAASIPSSVGLSAPVINYGKLRNRGVEFEVGHRNKIGDFMYGLNFMATFNRNEVLELRAPSYGDYIYEVGKPYGEHYLYIWDGIFQSDEDIANSARHPNNPQPGDIKFKDLDNNGVIDGNDRQMVEGVYPRMLYSFNLDFSYKNFDLAMFFQGVKGRKIWTNFFGEDPFSQGAPPGKKFLNAWTPENTDTDVPALYAWGYAPMTGTRSTYHLKDASYLRLKNLQLGYNVPNHITQKAGVDFLRIYFSGENLLTFTPYPDYDPERAGDGWHTQYPQAKSYSIGLNIRF